MAKINKTNSPGVYTFKCPGCGDYHQVNTDATNGSPVWGFNGNIANPTFSPSLLVRTGHYCIGHKPDTCWCTYKKDHPDFDSFKCYICHSFITDGKIQFLSDCTHELAGRTVELTEIE